MSGSMANYTFGNTPSAEANKLQWVKIKDGDKTLLICDRVILVNVSWDDLNGQGYVTGKTVTGSHGIPLTADITAEELHIGADMEMTEAFLAMGIDELSVSPACVLPLRKKIRETSVKERQEEILKNVL